MKNSTDKLYKHSITQMPTGLYQKKNSITQKSERITKQKARE
jgi:hypothetical protein